MPTQVARGRTSPCTRCGRPVMVNAMAMGEVLELCRACDRHDPAAAQVIAWTLVDAGNPDPDPAAMAEGAWLMIAWMKSEMAKRGWAWTAPGPDRTT